MAPPRSSHESSVELSNGGVRFPIWFVGVAAAALATWNGWISVQLIQTNSSLIELRAQVRSTSVPEGVEKALSELRSRMNADASDRSGLIKLATENALNITYLQRELQELRQRQSTLSSSPSSLHP